MSCTCTNECTAYNECFHYVYVSHIWTTTTTNRSTCDVEDVQQYLMNEWIGEWVIYNWDKILGEKEECY